MKETAIQREIMLAVGNRPDVRIWRNNSGVARQRRKDGSKGRPVKFGLVPGAADIIGIIAGGRFLAIECKTINGRLSQNQKQWRAVIERFGGLYILARSAQEAVTQLEKGVSR